MWITLIICISIVLIVGMGIGVEEFIKPLLDYKGKKIEYMNKKMIEEHTTANLALAYQILNTRPELNLEDIQQLIETNSSKVKLIDEK